MVKLIQAAEADFYKDKLESASPCDMFRVVKGLTTCPDRTFPTGTSKRALAEEFERFFHQKVANIRTELDAADCMWGRSDPAVDIGVDVGYHSRHSLWKLLKTLLFTEHFGT